MKYEVKKYIRNRQVREKNNAKALSVVLGDNTNFVPHSEIYNLYTGIGGLHNLEYSDYDSYYSFSEDKKEIEQGQFFTPDHICEYIVDCIRPKPEEK